MLRTVIDHTYNGNLAVDASGFFNHGIPVNVSPLNPGFAFNRPGSRINVRPSRSLRDLRCIRTAVKFSLQPRGSTHRYNLVEGFLSFALAVYPDFSLSGGILDASSNWNGATSAPGTVKVGTTHIAGMECDGINMIRLFLDGNVVAETYKVLGTVRDIGALGLAVGHWPDPPNQYTFEGTIFQMFLQKYDPVADLTNCIDPCCFDRAALARWYVRMAKKGISRTQLVQAGNALIAATRNAAVSVRAGDKTATSTHHNIAASLAAALGRRDFAAVEFVLNQAQQFAAQQLDQTTLNQLSLDIQKALAQFGLNWSDWCEFLRLVCLDPCGTKKKGCGDAN